MGEQGRQAQGLGQRLIDRYAQACHAVCNGNLS